VKLSIAVFVVVVMLGANAGARTWYVNPSGTGDAPNIQAAIDSSSHGDIVELANGTYTGVGNRDIQMYGKALTLRGQSGDASSCIIDAGDEAGHRGLYIGGTPGLETLVEDITFTGGDIYASGGGVSCGDCRPSFLRCIFRDNIIWAGSGAGLFADVTCSLYVSECVFEGNGAGPKNGGGLAAYGYFRVLDSEFINNWGTYGSAIRAIGATGTIIGCTFHSHSIGSSQVMSLIDTPLAINACTFAGNSGSSGTVIASSGFTPPVLNNCIIAFNTGLTPVACVDATPSVGCTDIYGNDAGDWVGCIAGQAGLTGNFSEDPRFCNAASNNYAIHITSPCTAANSGGCGLVGAHNVGCGPETYVLNDAGTGDFPTIQAAIDASWDGDTIELLDGTYTGDGNRDLDFLGKALTLRSQSGDSSGCIIDAGGSSAGRHTIMIFDDGEGPSTIIEGLTLSRGYSPITFGAGASCIGSSPSFVSCVFDSNRSSGGGGLWVDLASSPSVTKCLFTGNYANAAGGGALIHGDATLTDCEFRDNDLGNNGSALALANGAPTITDCDFIGNDANMNSAVWMELCDVEFNGCTFSGNSGPFGAIYGKWGSPLITECTFTLNSADSGACVNWDSSGVEISQCTFVANSGTDGSVLWTKGSLQPAVYSCILAFNTGAVPVYCVDGPPSLACCDIYGNDSGDWVGCIASQFGMDSNVRIDPLFCGSLNPDEPYSLQLESPCMADSAPPGCPRLGAHDVGCTGGSGVEQPEPGNSDRLTLAQAHPNPFTGTTEIRYVIPEGSGSSPVNLSVYNATGRRVKTLVSTDQGSGAYRIAWDATNHNGDPVASGVYFYSISHEGESRTRRIVFIR
jgi:hypothetical protein